MDMRWFLLWTIMDGPSINILINVFGKRVLHVSGAFHIVLWLFCTC